MRNFSLASGDISKLVNTFFQDFFVPVYSTVYSRPRISTAAAADGKLSSTLISLLQDINQHR